MTVSTEVRFVQVNGDALATTIAMDFPFVANADITVESTVIATGVTTLLVDGTHYTLSGAGSGAGTVNILDPATDFPATVRWTVTRDTPKTQPADFVTGSNLNEAALEGAFDRTAKQTSENQETVERAIKLPITDLPGSKLTELPSAEDRASQYLFFDASGNVGVASGVTPGAVTVTAPFGEDLVGSADKVAGKTVLGIDVGLESARPATPAAEEDIYIADDTKRLWVGDGGAWVRIGGVEKKTNHLINGSFGSATNFVFNATGVPQYNTPTPPTDTTRIYDAWRIFMDSAGSVADVYTIENTSFALPKGAVRAMSVEQTVADTKWGVGHMVEDGPTQEIVDEGVASYRFFAMRGSASTASSMRHALIEWRGVKNAMPSDPVTTWGAEGTNPTLAANFFYANTPTTSETLTGSMVEFKAENVAITASVNNLMLLIWADVGSPASFPVADTWNITAAQLIASPTIDDEQVDYRTMAEEMLECSRHYFSVGGLRRKVYLTGVGSAAAPESHFTSWPTAIQMAPDGGISVIIGGTDAWDADGNVSAVAFTHTPGAIVMEVTVAAAGYFIVGNNNAEAHIYSDGWLT